MANIQTTSVSEEITVPEECALMDERLAIELDEIAERLDVINERVNALAASVYKPGIASICVSRICFCFCFYFCINFCFFCFKD